MFEREVAASAAAVDEAGCVVLLLEPASVMAAFEDVEEVAWAPPDTICENGVYFDSLVGAADDDYDAALLTAIDCAKSSALSGCYLVP